MAGSRAHTGPPASQAQQWLLQPRARATRDCHQRSIGACVALVLLLGVQGSTRACHHPLPLPHAPPRTAGSCL